MAYPLQYTDCLQPIAPVCTGADGEVLVYVIVCCPHPLSSHATGDSCMPMLSLATIAAAGTASALWLRQRATRRPSVQPYVLPPKEEVVEARLPMAAREWQHAWARLDDRYHRFIHRYINTRLNAGRQAQWQSLVEEEIEVVISPEAKVENWRLARNSGIALTAALAYLAPVWMTITIPLAIYEVYSNILFARDRFRLARRIEMEQLFPLVVGGLWLTGYFITGAVSMLIYDMAMKMAYLAQDRTRARLINVLGTQPRHVWVLVDGAEIEIPLEQLAPNATLVVQAGQTVPVDGTILAGHATLDQQRLTGEEQPIEKGPGDAALAGTLVLSGHLHIQVEKTGNETLAAQIGHILEQTLSHHLVVEQRARRMANAWVTPSLLTSSATLVTLGLKRAVAVIINMPAVDMAIIGPLTLMNYLNLASRSHILIKDGRALELLHTVDTVIFDKTGTLTFGSLNVCAIYCEDTTAEDLILTYAAAAEQRQSHPLAQAIVDAAVARCLSIPAIANTQVELGYGLRVWLKEGATDDPAATQQEHEAHARLIRVGSERFMAMEALPIPETLQTIHATCQAQGHSLVFVARDTQIIGAIELQPTVRPEAAAVIAALKERKITTMIISGDQEAPTRKLAAELQVDRYYANVLPTAKGTIVAELQAAGRTVCFVGDGINDALALKQAHISISLRGATSVATDTAAIVMMDQSLQNLPALIDLSHELNRNITTNLALTTIPAIGVVGGVLFFNFGIPISLGAFTVTFALSIANAMAPTRREQITDM
ncbi:MAG: heavy metal translocating P-type ATPase [Candidatus Viridilinea halotolerans]|uniref:Heavy metal translocating P-type ATPase n=1 Tax=Candidatus Viridilinea halotolerans TaxID=2491704 RepID=A0A426U3F0_9CHLR|nr:MAG: heavy metal translocating P-type ATPase [Candidatus Viridilinea halotolerans]